MPKPRQKPKTRGGRHAAVIFVFITVTLDILALGIIIPVYPKLVEGFLGGNTAQAALTIGLFSTVFALMQFFFSPLVGALSDRFGRRPLILLSNFGLGMDYILMALAPSLHWLFVGRIISGMTAASVPTAGAYIADVTPPKKRAAAFGLIGAAFGIGFVLGPALGGILGHMSPRLPFWVAAGMSLLNWCYGYFVLPESLIPSRRAPLDFKKANPFGALKLLRSHRDLFGLAFVNFLIYLAHNVLQNVYVLYVYHRYAWDERMVGISLMLVGIGSGAVQGGLVRPIVKKFKERKTLIAGLLFGVAGFCVFGLAPTGILLMAGIPLLSLWGMGGPALQSLMTRHVSHREQGRLQGANGCLRGISEMIGPGIFTAVFAWSIGPQASIHLPGSAFFLAAILLLAGVGVAWKVARVK